MAISENFSKKRGRPRLLEPGILKVVSAATDAHSLRHKQDVHYRLRALGVLLDDSRFIWLCDGERMRAGLSHSYRPTILAALGRIADEADMRDVALELCETKPKARDAIQIVRRWRLGDRKPGDALQLANEIVGTINGYLSRHPTTWQQVKGALAMAQEMVEEASE
jgi:hypothetical protein